MQSSFGRLFHYGGTWNGQNPSLVQLKNDQSPRQKSVSAIRFPPYKILSPPLLIKMGH